MAWTAETAPPPYFGVVTDGEPTLAHGFDKDGMSICGKRLRLMESKAETELLTCQACIDESRRRERDAT